MFDFQLCEPRTPSQPCVSLWDATPLPRTGTCHLHLQTPLREAQGLGPVTTPRSLAHPTDGPCPGPGSGWAPNCTCQPLPCPTLSLSAPHRGTLCESTFTPADHSQGERHPTPRGPLLPTPQGASSLARNQSIKAKITETEHPQGFRPGEPAEEPQLPGSLAPVAIGTTRAPGLEHG